MAEIKVGDRVWLKTQEQSENGYTFRAVPRPFSSDTNDMQGFGNVSNATVIVGKTYNMIGGEVIGINVNSLFKYIVRYTCADVQGNETGEAILAFMEGDVSLLMQATVPPIAKKALLQRVTGLLTQVRSNDV